MNTPPTLRAIACAVVLAGCAHQAAPVSHREQRITAAEIDLGRMEATLATLSAENQPDCTHVCSLVTNICDLAKRICDLTRHDDLPALHARCTDGKGRCDRARASAERCACP